MSNKPWRNIILAGLVCVSIAGRGCSYSPKYGFSPGDDSQADVDGLFRGTYEEKFKDYKTSQWQQEVKDLEADGAATSADLNVQLDYARALHLSGASQKSVAIYQAILKAQPDQYEALCSYATVLHDMRQYPQATELLKKAIAQKPGFRNRAEEFHLAMVDYQAKSQQNYQYARDHIFLDDLTPIWKNRRNSDENLSKMDFPDGYNSTGMSELLRQFPRFGEGWMVLGMLLEHEKDYSMAAKAYDRALERGTAHAADLRRYMATFREFGRSQDPGRLAGRRFVQLIAGLIALFILYKLYGVAARVIADVTGARAAKEEEARRRRLKHKDPDAPL